MMTSPEHSVSEREYTLTEAARLLNKTEAALRMRIKRGTLRANVRYIDDTGERYQYMIPESELERERERGHSTLGVLEGGVRSAAETVRDFYSQEPLFRGLAERLTQLEKAVEKEREDTRALIRGLERQVELLTTMISRLLAQ